MAQSGSKFTKDLFERGIWTLAQAGVAFAAVELADAPVAYAPLIAAALAFVKGFVAKHLVSPEQDSASTVPGV